MTRQADDMVKVAAGSLTRVELWRQALGDVGIDCRVVGADRSGGLGTALPDSAELWVHSADAEKAQAAVRRAGKHQWEPEPPGPTRGHPKSDYKPERSGGPRRGAPPNRPPSP